MDFQDRKQQPAAGDNSSKSSSRGLVVLSLIILLSSLWRWFLVDEPLFTESRAGLIRPVHTALITDELYRNNFNPFTTEAYYKGGKGRFVQEFPLYNMVVALFYKLFGVNLYWGIILSITAFALALMFFYLFLKDYLSETASLGAVFLMAFSPYSILYSRLFQPLSLDMMLLITNIYLFKRFLAKQSWGRFAVSFFVLLIHLLQKGIFLVMGLVMLVMVCQKTGSRYLRDVKLWLLAGVPAALTVAWYVYGTIVTQKTAVGYNYFLSLKDIFNLRYQQHIWGKFIESSALMLSPLGIILVLPGIFLIKNKKLRSIVLAWMAAFLVFGLFFPLVWKAHPFYHLFPAYALVIAIVSTLQFAVSKSARWARWLVVFFLAAYFLLYTAVQIKTDFKAEEIAFLKPTAHRIADRTQDDSRVLFMGDDTWIWHWEWQYATGRNGYQRKATTSPEGFMGSLKKGLVDDVALIRWRYKWYKNPYPLHYTVRHSLFREYRLSDSYLDEYLLFDTSKTNLELTKSPGYFPLDIRFENGITLAGILNEKNGGGKSITSVNEPSAWGNYGELSFFWRMDRKTTGNLYLLVVTKGGDLHPASHKVMSNAHPLKYWKKGWLYAEQVDAQVDSEYRIEDFKILNYYLYNRSPDSIVGKVNALKIPLDDKQLKALARTLVRRENERFFRLSAELRTHLYSTSRQDWR